MAARFASHRSTRFHGACLQANAQSTRMAESLSRCEEGRLRRAWQAARQEMSAPALAPRNWTADRSYTCIRYLITPAIETAAGQPRQCIDGSQCHKQLWQFALQKSNARVSHSHPVALIRMTYAGAPSPACSLHRHTCVAKQAKGTTRHERTELPEEEDPATRARNDWRRFNRRAAGHSRRLPSLQAGRCITNCLHRN